jgi:hypothetical protein
MDTRFWGPPGWKLLHLTATGADQQENVEEIRKMFLLLPFILPCKFCRQSLAEYYKDLPVPNRDFSKWLWLIHNKVNEKLRKQGLCDLPNPSFEMIDAQYKNMYSQGCTRVDFPGWNFLFSIADNHPIYSKSIPFDSPNPPPKSFEDRNQHNLLKAKERLVFYKEFFQVLPHSFPYKEWRESFLRYATINSMDRHIKTRTSLLKWLYKIRYGMSKDLQWLATNTYNGICREVRQYRSGCAKDKKAKTCRMMGKTKRNFRETRKQRNKKATKNK